MKLQKKFFRAAVIVTLSISIILLVAGFVLSHFARSRFDADLKAAGITISSLRVNLFTRSVTIKEFEWTYQPDSLYIPMDSVSRPLHHVSVQTINADGVDIYQLVRFKKLKLQTLTFKQGEVLYNQAIRRGDSTKANVSNIPFKELQIGRISVENIQVRLHNDSIREYSGTLNISLQDFRVHDLANLSDQLNYSVNQVETAITSITIDQRDGMYRFGVSKIAANSSDQTITIDSFKIQPKYSKYKFARKVGKQIDRYVALFPKVAIKGFHFADIKDSIFRAERVAIKNADLQIYRDKRLPFIKKENMPLPIAMIRGFAFGLAIDSLTIEDSRIRYELFPEKGYHSGELIFQNLNATLDHLSNRDLYAGYSQATLIASSNILGNGSIKATFSLPYGPQQRYNAKGTINNIALYKLSPMLENVAFISIESGKLNNLNFNFDYNDVASTGAVVVNYKDLKIKTLTKEEDPDTNEFKSFIANLILKKDKDKSVPIEKRTGKIDYQRDRKRAIFHLWVRSLFSGLKSSIMDPPAKKDLNASQKNGTNKETDHLSKRQKRLKKKEQQEQD